MKPRLTETEKRDLRILARKLFEKIVVVAVRK